MTIPNMLKTENLKIKMYRKLLCNQLNVEFNSGQVWGILGCNGSGKTTLLHTLAGLEKPTSGDVLLHKKSIMNYPSKERARAIALLLQHQDDNFPSTVLETLSIGRHPHCQNWQWGNHDDHTIIIDILKKMGLEQLADRDIRSLSGGERRRVAIATVLAQQPEIYLLDEPTNHLDIKHQIQILNLFRKLAKEKNKTIIMAIHDINQAAHFCDQIVMMKSDGATLTGSCNELLIEKNLSQLYETPIKRVTIDKKDLFISTSL